jgi:glycosyltransferase involved in cell wall biosynthesis
MAACLMLQFPKKVLFCRYDVCFASWLYPDADALRMISRLRNLKLVSMALGTDVNAGLFNPKTQRGTCKVLRESTFLVLVSNALKEIVIAEGAEVSSAIVIYTGVDHQKFCPIDRNEARRNLRLPQLDKIVLFVGSLIVTKGCFELVQAIANLNRKGEGTVRLIMIGTGADREKLEEHINNLQATQFVQLVGPVQPSELRQWYGSANLFCLPSHREGVPNVILESLACGIPVVATPVGGIPEVLSEQAGRFVSVNNVQDLEIGLKHSFEKKFDQDQIVDSAAKFDWDRCAKKITELLGGAAVR